MQNVFDIEDLLSCSPQTQKCLQAVRHNPDSAQLLEERCLGSEFSPNNLLKLPKGLLSFPCAKMLSALRYDPRFWRRREVYSGIDCITCRVRKARDLYHVLAGSSFDDLGEFGVIAVAIGQIQCPVFRLICLQGFLLSFIANPEPSCTKQPREDGFDLVSEGIRIAREATSLFPVKFEQGLERPIDEWVAS
jgi:ubiquinone biosynthesis protein COQ4